MERPHWTMTFCFLWPVLPLESDWAVCQGQSVHIWGEHGWKHEQMLELQQHCGGSSRLASTAVPVYNKQVQDYHNSPLLLIPHYARGQLIYPWMLWEEARASWDVAEELLWLQEWSWRDKEAYLLRQEKKKLFDELLKILFTQWNVEVVADSSWVQ